MAVLGRQPIQRGETLWSTLEVLAHRWSIICRCGTATDLPLHSVWEGMSYSFDARIGMAFRRANSERTVVIAGVGTFFMHGMGVYTAVY
ncbi:hypothetical protein [Mycobacterium uberis]|uniref:hypothetical protein n=1 Tax=Mycobacterium uberis TaxID=2162698 RepID=UPI001058B693|nr:hypothetical protein [Mycobacterium uberis]